MTPIRPILLADLFPDVEARLVELLRGLAPEDWGRPTVCSGWNVGDIAAHLLDGNLRRLSMGRDGHTPSAPATPIRSVEDVVALVNEQNARWTAVARSLSPAVLIDLLERTSAQVHDYFAALDPEGRALFGVSWAGQATSPNWFDVAREYTERWHHQQQIRDAVGASPLTDRKHLYPVLDTFMRGLPHAYRAVHAPDGTAVVARVSGEAGGAWSLIREEGRWTLYEDAAPKHSASIELRQDDAWRLFTKGLTTEAVRPRAVVQGDAALVEPALTMTAVVA